MAHAQIPNFVFRRNGRVHLNRWWEGGGSVQSTTGRRAVHIRLQGLYCSCKPVFCSNVTLTGYPLHSPVSPLLLPCVTVCHHISNAVYSDTFWVRNLGGAECEAITCFEARDVSKNYHSQIHRPLEY
jgi:hypothetical protein